MPGPRAAAWTLASLTALVVIVDGAVVAVAGQLHERLYVGIAGCLAIGTVSLAVLVARQQPRNRVGPLLAWMGLLAAVVAFEDNYAPAQARRPDLLPHLPDVASAALVVTWVWLYVAVGLLMLYFPDGRLPGRQWSRVALGLPLVGIAIQALMAVSPGPYDPPFAGVHHPFGDLPAGVALASRIVLFPAIVLLVLAAAASLRVRFRQGDAVRRAQVKWLALAGLLVPVTVLLSWVGYLLTGSHGAAGLGLALLYAAVPVATAIAVLRHNLYDVDRALSTAVTYSVVTLALLVVFGVAAFVSGIVFGRDSTVAAAGVTAVTTLLIAPLRTRLQRIVDRHLYPMRRAALSAIEDLQTAIAAGRARPEDLEGSLRTALRDADLRIAIVVPGDHGYVDPDGHALDVPDDAVPISAYGRRIGAIASRGPAPRQLLREVGEAAAMLVEMGRLRLELSAALHQVGSSRSRLQRLGYEERRRLERDLHDGAQQRLVSLGMALRLAQRHLGDSSLDVDGLLDESVAQLGTAVAELREVAHGLRPSCLDDGLQPALSALAETATLPVDLDVDAGHAIPDDIATTAYYVVSEAVANAVKHADATRLRLRIVQDTDELHVRVEDDGRGGATVRPGSGLAGLSDRVAAAGGSLSLHSVPRGGTVLEARLPCAS